VVDQMQLIAPQVLDRGGAGRAPEESGELTDHADITGLRLRCELAYAHVVDQALAQRTDIPAGVSHGSVPVEERGGFPSALTSAWLTARSSRARFSPRAAPLPWNGRRRRVALSQPCTSFDAPQRADCARPGEPLILTIRKSNGPVRPSSGNPTLRGAPSFLFRRSRDGIELAPVLTRAGCTSHVAVRYKAA
jgi:hypothetical protein